MSNRNETLLLVYRCIDELNRLLPSELRLAKSEETVLLGYGGTLDSLGLISLIVSLEDAVEQATGHRVVVLEEELLIDPAGPYRSVGQLVNWINTKLN